LEKLDEICSTELCEYLEQYIEPDSAEPTEKALKEIVRARGIKIVMSCMGRSQALIPAGTQLLGTFCELEGLVASPGE
jgi:hypothetical protein